MVKKIFTFLALTAILLLLAVPVALATPNPSDWAMATAIAHAGCRGCGPACCQQSRGGRAANPQCEGCGDDCCRGRRDAPILDNRIQDSRRAMPPPLENRRSTETIIGEIVAIETIPQGEQRSTDVRLQMKTDTGHISVRLGPAWYLDQQDVQLQAGDYISVAGTQMRYAGMPVMIASEVRKGDQVLILRNPDGLPVWRGGRRMRTPSKADPN